MHFSKNSNQVLSIIQPIYTAICDTFVIVGQFCAVPCNSRTKQLMMHHFDTFNSLTSCFSVTSSSIHIMQCLKSI